MAVTEAFLASCRTVVEASAELTAFRAAYAAFDAASTSDKPYYWSQAYEIQDAAAGTSVHYRLKAAIRQIVNGLATSSMTAADKNAATATLCGQYAPKEPRPQTSEKEAKVLSEVLVRNLLSDPNGA